VSANGKRSALPSFSLMLVSLVLGLVFFDCIHQPLLADPDIGWHLRDAQLLLQNHAFIRTDPYTFSLNGHAWMNPEWLGEMFFYMGWRAFGLRGVETVTILLIELMAAGICFLTWQRTRSMRPAALATIIWLIFSSVSIAPRPQLCGWLCLIVELAVLEHFRTLAPARRHYLWTLPPLFAFWINLHGSWPIGFVMLLAYLACGLKTFSRGALQATAWTHSQRSSLMLFAIISVVAVFLNPYGWHLVAYPFVIAGKHPITLNSVQEWQSLDMHSLRGRLVLLAVAGLLLSRALSPRPWRLYDVFSLFLAVFAGFTYSRFLLFTGIILCPLLADEATKLLGRDNPAIDKRWLNAGIVAVMLGFCVTHLPTTQQLTTQSNTGYPAKAVAYLRQHPPAGPMLNDFNWGGYVIWNDPAQPIFIDTRADVFEQTGLLKSYLDLINLQLPVEDFTQSQFRYVFFPKNATIVAALNRSPNWTVDYQDETAVLLRRIK
jgi:hypothetical protein